MFGLATKRQLDTLSRELDEKLHHMEQLEAEREMEWARWFNKFRALYAMLLKREKSGHTGVAEGEGSGAQADGPPQPPRAPLIFPHSRRGW